MPAADDDVSALAHGIVAGDRRSLARGITLVESARPDHRARAVALLDALMVGTGAAARVGISGAPGVGKSTFIEALGLRLVGEGHRVAVVAVDPSSSRSGGSILGDKTRMADLARSEAAFVRPSPSGGDLGGVARRSREVLLLCEAAGYDVVLVETVGVGQSEIAVGDLVDTFVLLVSPGGGDELQGVKRGIMELADVVVVTKADGDLAVAARRAEADYRHAVHFLRRRHDAWEPPVLAVSSPTGTGIGEVWETVKRHRETLTADGALAALRADQAVHAMWSEVEATLVRELRSDVDVVAAVAEVEPLVRAGALSPAAGAARTIAAAAAGRR